MRRLWLLAVASGSLWTMTLVAQEQPKTKVEENQARDAAVLETVLVDLLTQPDSPVESRKETKKEIHFSAKALRYEIKTDEILRKRDEEKLKKLSTEQRKSAREAAEHVTQRVEKKDFFREFLPKDKRIKLFSKQQDEASDGRNAIGGEQVFRAYSPGYSRDQEVAVVHLLFTWAGNRHAADATYVLGKKKDGWTLLWKDVTRYP